MTVSLEIKQDGTQVLLISEYDATEFAATFNQLNKDLPSLFPQDAENPLLPAQTPTSTLLSPLQLLQLPGTLEDQVQAYTFCYETLHSFGDEFPDGSPIYAIRKELAVMAGILKEKAEAGKQEATYEALKEVQEAQPTIDTDPIQAWEDTFNAVLDQNRPDPDTIPSPLFAAMSYDSPEPFSTSFYVEGCYCSDCKKAREAKGDKFAVKSLPITPKSCKCGECVTTEDIAQTPIKIVGESDEEKWKKAMVDFSEAMKKWNDKFQYPRPVKSILPPVQVSGNEAILPKDYTWKRTDYGQYLRGYGNSVFNIGNY